VQGEVREGSSQTMTGENRPCGMGPQSLEGATEGIVFVCKSAMDDEAMVPAPRQGIEIGQQIVDASRIGPAEDNAAWTSLPGLRDEPVGVGLSRKEPRSMQCLFESPSDRLEGRTDGFQ